MYNFKSMNRRDLFKTFLGGVAASVLPLKSKWFTGMDLGDPKGDVCHVDTIRDQTVYRKDLETGEEWPLYGWQRMNDDTIVKIEKK